MSGGVQNPTDASLPGELQNCDRSHAEQCLERNCVRVSHKTGEHS